MITKATDMDTKTNSELSQNTYDKCNVYFDENAQSKSFVDNIPISEF